MNPKMDGPSPFSDEEAKHQERAEERALFERYKANPTPAAEEAIVAKFMPLVYRIVHNFRFIPDQFDDLVQVGTLGLVMAIRRFDLALDYRFSTFAWPSIQGEIQRYFRDKTWAVNVPRDLKEKSLKVFHAVTELTAMAGQQPTVLEVALHLGLTEEAVQEALELGSAYHPQSFLESTRDSEASFAVEDDDDQGSQLSMDATKSSVFWSSMLKHLDHAEATTIRMYFFEQRTQREIADNLTTSQMNVSRIMRKALLKLRRLLAPGDIDEL
jgi:RNA polymerase sigma-B factor